MPTINRIKYIWLLPLTKYADINSVIHNMDIVFIFNLKGIPSLEKYEWMYGPKYLWDNSQRNLLLEDFIYNIVANNKKGVVGIRGKKIPRTPQKTKNDARAIYIYFFNSIIYW